MVLKQSLTLSPHLDALYNFSGKLDWIYNLGFLVPLSMIIVFHLILGGTSLAGGDMDVCYCKIFSSYNLGFLAPLSMMYFSCLGGEKKRKGYSWSPLKLWMDTSACASSFITVEFRKYKSCPCWMFQTQDPHIHNAATEFIGSVQSVVMRTLWHIDDMSR